MPIFDGVESVHIVGVGGTAMGTFAALLRAQGYSVRGSDEKLYPPMSDKLREWGISYSEGYAAVNLDPVPDLVVVGNVIRADNPEAARARDDRLNQASFPEALGALFLEQRHSVVVTGTHGKTTTASLIAFVLEDAGLDPSYLIGGVPQDGRESFRLGAGPHFVVEGDEYDTVYWDKVPKFIYYRPQTAVLTSVEFDHADIYADLDAVKAAFSRFVELIPEPGALLYAGAHATVREIGAAGRGDRVPYGEEQSLAPRDVVEGSQGLSFDVVWDGSPQGRVTVGLSGTHGVENALAAYGVARRLGLEHRAIAGAFTRFKGVRRRLELRGEAAGVSVIDDFAHHPTAVRVTLEGARRRFGRRLWALFEPRSATAARRIFQGAFAEAFDAADLVVIARSGRRGQLAPDESLDESALADALRQRGVEARYLPEVDEIVAYVVREARPGDVVVCMSNGAFGGIHDKLLEALAER